MDSVTVSGAMNASAMGIGIGTFLFAWLGIWLQRDWFLMMGLLACILGNVAFTTYLWEQGVPGERNDTVVALFCCLTMLTLYAVYCQCVEWFEEGPMVDENEALLEREEAAYLDSLKQRSGGVEEVATGRGEENNVLRRRTT
jgi:hypothetical protein